MSEHVHLAQNGSVVEIGDSVRAGYPVAITGDTGDVGAFPHLHFDISPCAKNLSCDTLLVTFRNTTANPNGLREAK